MNAKAGGNAAIPAMFHLMYLVTNGSIPSGKELSLVASVFDSARAHDATGSYTHVKALIWPAGPICPHSGSNGGARTGALNGRTTCIGLRKCYECHQSLMLKIGVAVQNSNAPLDLWLQATYLMWASKKGISPCQILRTKFKQNRAAPNIGKTFKPAAQLFSVFARSGNVGGLLTKQLHEGPRLVTDGSNVCKGQVISDESVDDAKFEWLRGDVRTNSLTSYLSIFKRSPNSSYQYLDKANLDRYLAEFEFSLNTRAELGGEDGLRTAIAVQGVKWKQCTYQSAV